MNSLNKFSLLSGMFFIVLLLSSCSSETTPNSELAQTPTTNETESSVNTRGTQQQIAIKAYHYKTLASFKKGKAEISMQDLATLAGKQVNLVVLYEAVAPWAEGFNDGYYSSTGNDYLNGLMESYNLEIIKQFSIDGDNEGLVLEPNATLSNPVEAAKDLSMVEHVLMVEVKEVPEEELDNNTVGVK
ncbi:MAG: hypothetical protein AB8E82_10715 [Aureispira sp.]